MSRCALHDVSLPCATCIDTDAIAAAIVAAEVGLPAWSQKDTNGRELMRGDRVRLADGSVGRALDFSDSGRRVLVRVSRTGPAFTVETASVCHVPLKAKPRTQRRRAGGS